MTSGAVVIPELWSTIIPTSDVEMENRRKITEKACRIKHRYDSLKKRFSNNTQALFNELRKLQTYVIQGKKIEEFEKEWNYSTWENGGDRFGKIFFLEKYRVSGQSPSLLDAKFDPLKGGISKNT